jgi:sugar lactone lactonase YvrE
LLGVLPDVVAAPGATLSALAPVTIVADGLTEAAGVLALDTDVYVTDRLAGTITRIDADGRRSVVVTRLERPVGLAVDGTGRIIVAEERAGCVVRLEADGRRIPLVTGLEQPRWLGVGHDETLYISANRVTRKADIDELATRPAGSSISTPERRPISSIMIRREGLSC